MTIYDVVKKLLGEINPIGETNTDIQRLENLGETLVVVEQLMGDIQRVAVHKDRAEYSVSQAGKIAHQFLAEVKRDLEDHVD